MAKTKTPVESNSKSYSANNTKLFYEKTADSFFEIPLLMEVPELGGAPEKIDVTTLSDKAKRYIPGIKDYGDLVFKFLYETGADGNYQLLKGLEDSDEAINFEIEYPDGTCHTFAAIPSIKLDSGTLNGAMTFSATMMLQSEIEFVTA